MKRVLLCLAIVFADLPAVGHAQVLPLRPSQDGRLLVDQTDTPVLLVADAAWSLMTFIPTADAKYYLDYRAAQGFNAIITALPPPWPLTPQKGQNVYGESPWTGQPFLSPNEAFFAHADTLIDYAASKGIIVILLPAFIGYQCSVDGYGWSSEMQSRSLEEMRAWGNWIGQRYHNRKNIIWSMGGDCDPTACGGIGERMLQVAAGIREYDPVGLMTNHNQRGTTGADHYEAEPWLTLNNVYVDPSNVCVLARQARSVSPAKPFFLVEGWYEDDDHNPTQQQLRAQTYWTMLMGGCGYLFGNLSVYMHNTDWMDQLTTGGTASQIHARKLFLSRHWQRFVPDETHVVMTSGYGTFGASDYATTATTSDSTSIIAYLPTQRTVTIDPSSLSGDSIYASWFNPTTGAFVRIGTYTNSTRDYVPPTSDDWVLVIDNALIAESSQGVPTGTFTAVPDLLPYGGGTVTLQWTSSNATSSAIDNQIGNVPLNGSVTVDVLTSTSFTLLLSGPDGTTSLSTLVSVDTPPQIAGSEIYSNDALTPPWTDIRSWSVTRTYNNKSPVYEGSTSARIVHSAWGSLQFAKGNWNSFQSIDPSTYQSLDFAISGSNSSFTMQVSCLNASGKALKKAVSFTVAANSWLKKSIPIDQLASGPFVSIQFSAGRSSVTYYLDDIRLVTEPTAPEIPVLLSPTNNATNQLVTPNLRWNPTLGAATYQLQVSTEQSFASLIVDESSLTGTSRQITDLENGTLYYWRVQARNSIGVSGFSPAWKFTTVAAPPPAPELLAPVNGSVDQTVPVTFRWHRSAGATTYRLEISADPAFQQLVMNDSTLTDSLRLVSLAQPLTTYYWRVLAYNAGGASEPSLSWSLTTSVAPPARPILAFPIDNAQAIALDVPMQWYVVAEASSYLLQIAKDSTFGQVISNQEGLTDTTGQFASLQLGQKYFWRVRAENNGGMSPFSLTRRFTTIEAVPATPLLISPTDASTDLPQSVTLRWNKAANASSYTLQLSRDSAFAESVTNTTSTDTLSSISALEAGAVYYWRVRATSTGGSSAWSAGWSFATGTLPDAPVPLLPVNAANELTTPVGLVWGRVANAASYHLQVSRDQSFSSVDIDAPTVTDTMRVLASLNDATTYYWRVRGRNQSGDGPFSPTWRFTTKAPPAPTMSFIYQESGLNSPWNDIRSWSITKNYSSTSPVYKGATSARFVHSPWASLQFSKGTWGAFLATDPSPYASLDFAVHGGSSGLTLKVNCSNASGKNIFNPISLTIPANTWQVQSIPMSQLANVPFVSINFSAGGSTVTFSLDEVGLVYAPGAPLAATTAPAAAGLADYTIDGRLDGRDLSVFASAFGKKDNSIADIGPAEGILPFLVPRKDGRVDQSDVDVFGALWTWSQAHGIPDATEEEPNVTTASSSRLVGLTSPDILSSLENQPYGIICNSATNAQTIEVTLAYDPTRLRVESISPTVETGRIFLTHIDNVAGTAVAAMASPESPITVEELAQGTLGLTLTHLTLEKDDSIDVSVRTFSDSSEVISIESARIGVNPEVIPQRFGLAPNYPNPFNPSTTIRFMVPRRSRVVIDVYDMLGQQVDRLVDTDFDAGIGEATWNARVSSGVYFCRMTAVSVEHSRGGFSDVRKMVLLR